MFSWMYFLWIGRNGTIGGLGLPSFPPPFSGPCPVCPCLTLGRWGLGRVIGECAHSSSNCQATKRSPVCLGGSCLFLHQPQPQPHLSARPPATNPGQESNSPPKPGTVQPTRSKRKAEYSSSLERKGWGLNIEGWSGESHCQREVYIQAQKCRWQA